MQNVREQQPSGSRAARAKADIPRSSLGNRITTSSGADDGNVLEALSAVGRLLGGFSQRGRELAARYLRPQLVDGGKPSGASTRLEELAMALRSSRGEASGVALASDLISTYAAATPEQRTDFFKHLADHYDPDPNRIAEAWTGYTEQGAAALPRLAEAVEAPRQELFRRLNLAGGGTAALVGMREDLLSAITNGDETLRRVDADLMHLLQSWFNRGFLSMRALDWSAPASLLEKVIKYEAVHDIHDWNDLRRRLEPEDRRCYAFFHPSLPDDPLIFVEVALTRELSASVQQILAAERSHLAASEATHAIFYSISNCQRGLRGISFGHFLIKQVAIDLQREHPNLAHFATLSPLPGFRGYLRRFEPEIEAWAAEPHDKSTAGRVSPYRRVDLEAAAVRYLTEAKSGAGDPLDPVSRFHLGNGARLERLNWDADTSEKGHAQSCGLMVNYLYVLEHIEENHEGYVHEKAIRVGDPFKRSIARLEDQMKKREAN